MYNLQTIKKKTEKWLRNSYGLVVNFLSTQEHEKLSFKHSG